jgi:DNA-binding NtrC family response regulator
MAEQKIIKILLVSQDKAAMSAFKAGLEENQVQTAWAQSGSNAIAKIAEKSFDLVVTDENLGDMTGLEFIEKVISKKPMVNCAAVTSLLPDDFHEASEGLGILMPLPVSPGQAQAEKLLSRLKTILEVVSEAQIRSKGKAQADRERRCSQHTRVCEHLSEAVLHPNL